MQALFASVSNTVSSYAKVYSMTSDDNEVPSAPMMKELSDLTHESAEDSEKILDLLLGRCTEESAFTRTKALRLLRFICQRGRPDFRLGLSRKTENVRACLHFRGALDEFRGDAPNVAVREAAKELMTAVFDTSSAATTQRMAGYGNSGDSSSYSDSSSSSMGSGKRMTGFGSDSMAPANEWQGSSSSHSSHSSHSSESQHYANSGFVRSLPPAAYQSPESNAAVGAAHAAHSQFASAAASGGTRKAGQVGGAWASAAPAALAPTGAAAAFGHQQSQAQQPQQQHRHSVSTNAPLTLNEVLASPSFEVERRLVDELTAEGGMRAQPAADVVAKFGKHAQTLAAVALLLLLDAKMAAGASPVSQLRALFGIEALIAHAHATFRDFVRAQLLGDDESNAVAAVRQTIGALRSAANRAVAEKANKISQDLGLSTAAAASSFPSVASSSAKSAASSGSGSADFLDLGSVAASVPATASSSSFDFLSNGASAPAAAAAPASASSFDFLSNGGAAPAAAPAGQDGSAFSFLSDAAAPAPAPATGGFDMFSSLSVKAPAAAASLDPFGLTPSAPSSTVKPVGDPLDFLSASASGARPAPAAAASSSFDFLGGGGGQAAAQPMMRNAYGHPQQQQQQQQPMGGFGMGYPPGMQQQPMGAYGMGMGMGMQPQQRPHPQMGFGMQPQPPHAFAFGNAAAADPFANIGASKSAGGIKLAAATTVNSKINDSFSFVNDMLKK